MHSCTLHRIGTEKERNLDRLIQVHQKMAIKQRVRVRVSTLHYLIYVSPCNALKGFLKYFTVWDPPSFKKLIY